MVKQFVVVVIEKNFQPKKNKTKKKIIINKHSAKTNQTLINYNQNQNPYNYQEEKKNTHQLIIIETTSHPNNIFPQQQQR